MADKGSHCQQCKSLEKYVYWNNLPQTKLNFISAMFGNFRHQMTIPEKFSNCFKGELGKWCILRGPSGNRWKVRVTRTRENCNRIAFSEGWGDFVKDHGIKVSDLLVFSLCGDSSFKVLIFEANCCELEGAYFTNNSALLPSPTACCSSLHEGEVEGEGGLGTEGDESESKSEESGSSLKSEDPRHGGGGGDDDDSFSEDLGSRGEVQKESKWRRLEKSRVLEVSSEVEEDYYPSPPRRGRQGPTSRRGAKEYQKVCVSNRRPVSDEEKERAVYLASKFELKHKRLYKRPMVLIVMLPTHVTRGFNVTIPREFASKHMIQEDHDVELKVPGIEGKWMVSCRWTAKQCKLRPRWPIFVLENNLEEHDVCVFELIRKGDLRRNIIPKLEVHIFRVVNNVTPLTEVRTA